jgi:hypothetical protein
MSSSPAVAAAAGASPAKRARPAQEEEEGDQKLSRADDEEGGGKGWLLGVLRALRGVLSEKEVLMEKGTRADPDDLEENRETIRVLRGMLKPARKAYTKSLKYVEQTTKEMGVQAHVETDVLSLERGYQLEQGFVQEIIEMLTGKEEV